MSDQPPFAPPPPPKEDNMDDADKAHVETTEENSRPVTPVKLPEIQPTNFEFDFSSFMDSKSVTSAPGLDKVQKRASNVQKLAEENEKLKEQLRAMSERIEEAERRRKELAHKQQKVMDPRAE